MHGRMVDLMEIVREHREVEAQALGMIGDLNDLSMASMSQYTTGPLTNGSKASYH